MDLKHTYRLVNIVLAGVFLIILVYSGIFSTKQDEYPIKCKIYELTGNPCPSCGLSRGLSECVRLNFKKANQFNESAVALFIFFILQLVLRIFTIFSHRIIKLSKLIRFDIIFSLVLFVTCFARLIIEWIHFYIPIFQ